MVEYSKDKTLSEILKALSDSTRRSLLTDICQQGASRITDLAEHYDMSLNAISKHIKVLEKCHLVKRKQHGRTHWISAELEQVQLIQEWIKQLQSMWALRLDKLEQVLTDKGKDYE